MIYCLFDSIQTRVIIVVRPIRDGSRGLDVSLRQLFDNRIRATGSELTRWSVDGTSPGENLRARSHAPQAGKLTNLRKNAMKPGLEYITFCKYTTCELDGGF